MSYPLKVARQQENLRQQDAEDIGVNSFPHFADFAWVLSPGATFDAFQMSRRFGTGLALIRVRRGVESQ
jgi:hypothetical protein